MERVKRLAAQITGTSGVAALEKKSPDDVVITMAIRSPLCKAKKGGFKDARTDELMLEMFRQSIAHSNIDPSLIGDICVGNVLCTDGVYYARAAALAAGFPETVPVQGINRFCSSGLMALTTISNQIRTGQIDIGLAVGVESMSQNPDNGGPVLSEEIAAHPAAADCPKPMGWTSENVAEDFNITRDDQDDFAAKSFQKAEKADKAGYFQGEIVPFTVYQNDPATGTRKRVIVTKDDGIRYGTTKDNLAKIRSAFPQWGKGTTTGGNASQITDGAASVLLMTRRKAEELGLKIIAKHVTTTVAGVPPRVMGIGPIFAIPAALEKSGLTKEDVDLFEINEAFASQAVYCVRELALDGEKVNVNGGAIALGHPLGCTGARQLATGLNELERRKGRVLVTSMCIGTGMGAAGVFVREA
ncbi:thiolase [Pleurotus eryngii]|uniref:Thiolase n=1 Tax=Pleurotus eryngii TaxID=5323 RepID=A0A9P6ABS1_PLEER|nr:thiolase [Pleurotus eryngii]